MTQTANVPTLEDLRARREDILRIAAARDAHNVRVFGSVARGDADKRSDIHFLVDIVTEELMSPKALCATPTTQTMTLA